MSYQREIKIMEIISRVIVPGKKLRHDFLKHLCGEDKELYDEVLPVLELEKFDQPVHDALVDGLRHVGVSKAISLPLPNFSDKLQPLAEGETCGPFKLIEPLGEGGMGVVWLAERLHKVKQLVALKILHPSQSRGINIRSFDREQQILASLRHKYIAMFVDAGTSASGVPYFAMEYVEGKNLIEYHQEKNLSVNERVSLFIKICEAVSFAHSQLVVHRDLKPSNIMVRTDGHPMLLDFGIAVLLDPTTQEMGTITQAFEGAMTPNYASPEQVRGERLTPSSDIYSLGVILFELLTGTRPYQIESNTPFEMVEKITQRQPLLASTAAARKGSHKNRQEMQAAKRLQRQLKGDLDNIIARAMEQDLVKRYRNAEAFAKDLDNYLQGLPVEARSATYFYRATRFAKRHTLMLCSLASLIILLSAFSIYSIRQARLMRLERDQAEEVTGFMVELFNLPDPIKVQEGLSAQELLDMGAERIRNELKGQPDLRARLMFSMGHVYLNLSQYEKASELLNAAEQHFSEQKQYLKQAAVMQDLGELEHEQGHYEKAQKIHQRSLELRRMYLPQRAPEIVRSLSELGKAYYRMGDNSKACDLLEEAVHLCGDVGSETLTNTLHNLALVYKSMGNLEKAESCYREVLKWDAIQLGPNHPYNASTLNNLANLLDLLGRSEEAVILYKKAIAIYNKNYPDGSPDTAIFLGNMSTTLMDLGRVKESEAVILRAMEMGFKYWDESHLNRATLYNNYAMTLHALGKYEEAMEYIRRAWALRKNRLPNDHEINVLTRCNAAQILASLGQLEEANTIHRKAEPLLENIGRKDTLMRAKIGLNHAMVLYELTHWEEAVTRLEPHHETLTRILAPKQPHRVLADFLMGALCKRVQCPTDLSNLLDQELPNMETTWATNPAMVEWAQEQWELLHKN